MEVLTLLETLQEMLDRSSNIPLTKKSLVDKEAIIDVVNEIKLKLPDELKQAKWVKEERQKILVDAQKEANQLIKEAENRIIAMIDEHEITKKAYEQKAEIIDSANAFSKDLINGTKKYADEIGDTKSLSFLGFLNNPFEIIKESKIMILTSKFEGTPMVALEALSLGTPIVSTKTDGMVDLLNDKIGALYDTNEEARDIIVNLLQDKSKLEKMSQEAIVFSKNYNDIEKYKAKLKVAYGVK